MVRRAYQTNRLLWVILSLITFILLGLIKRVPGEKAVNFWQEWIGFFERGGFATANSDTYIALPMLTVLHAIPAVVLGWVGQAIIQVVLSKPQFHESTIAADTPTP